MDINVNKAAESNSPMNMPTNISGFGKSIIDSELARMGSGSLGGGGCTVGVPIDSKH